MEDVMLDLETMGVGNNAAIVAIGAVEFDPYKRLLGEEFYQVIDLESSVANGGIIDASTVMWWLKQSDEARAALTGKGVYIGAALNRFTCWMEERDDGLDVCVWGNGAAFDNVILRSAYERLNMEAPWKFWDDRCYRTLKALFSGCKAERLGTYHNAIDDAKTQAVHLMEIMSTF